MFCCLCLCLYLCLCLFLALSVCLCVWGGAGACRPKRRRMQRTGRWRRPSWTACMAASSASCRRQAPRRPCPRQPRPSRPRAQAGCSLPAPSCSGASAACSRAAPQTVSQRGASPSRPAGGRPDARTGRLPCRTWSLWRRGASPSPLPQVRISSESPSGSNQAIRMAASMMESGGHGLASPTLPIVCQRPSHRRPSPTGFLRRTRGGPLRACCRCQRSGGGCILLRPSPTWQESENRSSV